MPDLSSLKARLKHQKLLRDFPRRGSARFTDSNDHNPTVLQDCSTCHGRGRVCREECIAGKCVASLDVCPACNGEGITGHIEPYFADPPPALPAELDALGWLTCPLCAIRFSTHDRAVWTGRRHKTCGQAISLTPASPGASSSPAPEPRDGHTRPDGDDP